MGVCCLLLGPFVDYIGIVFCSQYRENLMVVCVLSITFVVP